MPEIKIILPSDEEKKKKVEEDEEEVHPGLPSIDDVLGAPANMLIKFFDLGTIKSGDDWIEMRDFFRNDSAGVSLEERTLTLDKAVYETRPQIENYAFRGNLYDYSQEDLQAEFSPDNELYLERMPLKPIITLSNTTDPLQVQERDSQYRWDGVGVNTPLMHVSLIRKEESVDKEEGDIYRWTNQDVNPAGLLEGGYAIDIPEEKKNSTWIYGSNTELGYVIRNIWIRKAHLKIQEYGSHSTCVSCGTGEYTVDNEPVLDGAQIVDMVEGIFWNSFNTYRDEERSASEQLFKITKECDYNADAHTECILTFSPAKTTKVEVYLMPRKWWYYAHFASYGVIEEEKEGYDPDETLIEGMMDSGEQPGEHNACEFYFPQTKRDLVTNYHNIFCLWDRPPFDFVLPRRDDDIRDFGSGRIGRPISTSLWASTQLIPSFDFTGIGDPTITKYPMQYYSLYEGSFQTEYWNEIIERGGLYDETLISDDDYYWTITDLTILGYQNYHYAWNDLSFLYENIQDPAGSAIGCKSSVNSLYLYNFCGPYFAVDWHTESYFYYNFETRNQLCSTHVPYPEAQDTLTLFMDHTGKTLDEIGDNYVFTYGWQSPIWIKTPSGAVPHRATRPWINQRIGAFTFSFHNSDPGRRTPPEPNYDTYQWGLFDGMRRNRFRSFYETFHWVYTPPTGGLFKFKPDTEEFPETINAGRCSPDYDELIHLMDCKGDAIPEAGEKDIIFKFPAYPTLERPLYTPEYDDTECENFDKIWNQIWNHEIVQDNVANIDQGTYPADNVPYMAGVALTKAETLVAVVKVDNSLYYIWRTKDEGESTNTGFPLYEISPVKTFPHNNVSAVPSMHSGGSYTNAVPLYGCLEVWDEHRQLGHIRTFDWKYPLFYKDYSGTCCRMTDSVVGPTLDWDNNSHDTFINPTYSTTYHTYVPWCTEFGTVGGSIYAENPIIGMEEIFELEQPVLLMTYRERARFDSGYGASWFANSNCANPSDETYDEIPAALRNKDLFEEP